MRRGMKATIAMLTTVFLLIGCATMPGIGGGLSDGDIVSGLKEVLIVGAIKAALGLGKLDGFLGSDQFRLPLPENISQYEEPLRRLGLGGQVDAIKTGLNRAAEKAVPKAKEIFVDEINKISFTDARRILFHGSDTEATKYFQEKTQGSLTEMLKPIVSQTMSEVGLNSTYQSLISSLGMLSGQTKGQDLTSFISALTVQGIFAYMGQEEKRVRTDPASRDTDLLKKVFGASK